MGYSLLHTARLWQDRCMLLPLPASNRWRLLFTYSKNGSATCTSAVLAFKDAHSQLSAWVEVLGISPDSAKSQAKTMAKLELPFTLIADPNFELITAMGCYGPKQMFGRDYMGVHRKSLLINPRGELVHTWDKPDAKTHPTALIQLLPQWIEK